MPVLEAMACGVPVVTTDCLGVRTFCNHGENCLVAAADDATGVRCRSSKSIRFFLYCLLFMLAAWGTAGGCTALCCPHA
jgi:hypothetical protein